MDCAARHRDLSKQYSFVRSLVLDEWTRRQIAFMEQGGNQKALEFMKSNDLRSEDVSVIDQIYKSEAMQRYKMELTKLVDSSTMSESPSGKENPLKGPQISFPTMTNEAQNPFANVVLKTNPFNVSFDKAYVVV
eukprot:TRINITY_DN3241_c0_g2_i5.p1 TRINITY_DN3241_c0_g2~~TRINITY_DN3241_c0_g2_i5.p1  ORF type:complete len:134 (+),score=29.68 TRINITY_DN3241_c0_g2_i5:278-679(+)